MCTNCLKLEIYSFLLDFYWPFLANKWLHCGLDLILVAHNQQVAPPLALMG